MRAMKERLLDAAQSLLWERGYESMSPKAVLTESGAGQGSMYHHFSGKKQLAIKAMERHEKFLWERTCELLGDDSGRSALEAIRSWLLASRDALAGCRLGRLVHEQSIRNDGELRAPAERYFRRLHKALASLLVARGACCISAVAPDADALASMLIAVVQGGYVLSLATGEKEHLTRAVHAADFLLRKCFDEPPAAADEH